eukprot:7183364-Prorocentrum_lima.AAC.1
MLPRIAPGRSLIPQNCHHQLCFRTGGNPVERVIQHQTKELFLDLHQDQLRRVTRPREEDGME